MVLDQQDDHSQFQGVSHDRVGRPIIYTSLDSRLACETFLTVELQHAAHSNWIVGNEQQVARSAIAERLRCSVGQFSPNVTGRKYFADIINHCDVMGLQSYRMWRNNAI